MSMKIFLNRPTYLCCHIIDFAILNIFWTRNKRITKIVICRCTSNSNLLGHEVPGTFPEWQHRHQP